MNAELAQDIKLIIQLANLNCTPDEFLRNETLQESINFDYLFHARKMSASFINTFKHKIQAKIFCKMFFTQLSDQAIL